MLISCAQTGDFGRRADNVVTRSILPGTGLVAAHVRGEFVSTYPFTDDETELRDRAWRFIMPAHEKAVFEMKVAELRHTRVFTAERGPDNAQYHRTLMGEPFRSLASRYRRLIEDVSADRELLGPFTLTAARVCEADRTRARGLDFVHQLSDDQAKAAHARIAENGMVIDWVRREVSYRTSAYRYALEHLVIEGPQREAIPAERALLALEADNERLQRLIACEHMGLPPISEHDLASKLGPPSAQFNNRRGSGHFVPSSPPPLKDAERLRPPK